MTGAAKKAIVIGTGAGGLVAAAYLAKAGFAVTALEQANQLGGYLNPFKRKGYHFDPGVHYVGECRPGELIHSVLKGVGLDAEALFCELEPTGFDHFHFPDLKIAMPKGIEAYHERLLAQFPQSREGLAGFFDTLASFNQAMKLMNGVSLRGPKIKDLARVPDLLKLLRWLRAPFGRVLDRHFTDPRLKAVLAAQSGDLGLPPSRVSALSFMGLLLHYLTGAWFPRSGSGKLRDALVEKAQSDGAVFRIRAAVKRIIITDGRATGVELEGGERLDADCVVSSIEPALTFGSLIEPALLPARLNRKVNGLEPSIGSFCLFLGMKRDLRKHGLGAFNIWSYPSYDLEALYAPVLRGEMWKDARDLSYIISPNSLKADTGVMTPPGCSTLEIITVAPFQPFARWADLPAHKRGPEYADLKKRLADLLIQSIDERYPGLVGDVETVETATPLTNLHYIRSVRGGIYGPAMTPKQMTPFRFMPRTAFKGLYLAGSGVFGAGVAACLMSGRIAAGMAAGKRV